MKIAICDDEKLFAVKLKEKINAYALQESLDFYVTLFSSPEELENSIDHFDIVFLDISFNGETIGIKWARRLRPQGYNTPIVLCSSMQDQILNGYDAAPVKFLIKPIDSQAVNEALAICIQKINMSNRTLSIISNGETILRNSAKIIYIESIGRQRIIHSMNNMEDITYESLKDLYKKLDNYNFQYAHKGYIINLAHLDTITASYVRMINGKTIYIGRTLQADLQKSILRFTGGVKLE